MTDEEIVEALRRERWRLSAVELATLLDKLTNGKLTQGSLVTYFKRAFPSIPLRVLFDAGGWHRVSGGGLRDQEVNELLRPWLGASGEP
jgi:hypothetical protein